MKPRSAALVLIPATALIGRAVWCAAEQLGDVLVAVIVVLTSLLPFISLGAALFRRECEPRSTWPQPRRAAHKGQPQTFGRRRTINDRRPL